MDDKQRLNLQEMIKQFDADDNTSKIRQLKHSRRIRDDVEKFINLKKKYSRMMTFEPKKFEKLVISHCNFLWTNYTNIFILTKLILYFKYIVHNVNLKEKKLIKYNINIQ